MLSIMLAVMLGYQDIPRLRTAVDDVPVLKAQYVAPPIITATRELPLIRSVANLDDELPGKATKKRCENCSIYCSCGCQLGHECKCQVQRGEPAKLSQGTSDPSRGLGVFVAPLAQSSWSGGVVGGHYVQPRQAAPRFVQQQCTN